MAVKSRTNRKILSANFFTPISLAISKSMNKKSMHFFLRSSNLVAKIIHSLNFRFLCSFTNNIFKEKNKIITPLRVVKRGNMQPILIEQSQDETASICSIHLYASQNWSNHASGGDNCAVGKLRIEPHFA